MRSDPKISELLVRTGAYTDLEQPVILTSGQLGIFYINTEKLLQDGGEWKQFGDDSKAMVDHAVSTMMRNREFAGIISSMREKVAGILPKSLERCAISGGQRRDWLFSGPVAVTMRLPHLSVYKDGKIDIITPAGAAYTHRPESNVLVGHQVLHISDLLTEASSCYRIGDGGGQGWVPWVRRTGATVENLLGVVTRLQGGEQRLAGIGVNAECFVAIDEDFLRVHSTSPERAVEYTRDPTAWSEAYLRENGALALVETFDPEGGKQDRARKFLGRYGDVLKEAAKFDELRDEAARRYGVQLSVPTE